MTDAPPKSEKPPIEEDSSKGFLPIVLGGALFAVAIVGLAIALGLTHELPDRGHVHQRPEPGPGSVVGRHEDAPAR